MRIGSYRPFTKSNIFFNRYFIENSGLSPLMFPLSQLPNQYICVTGKGSNKDFSCIISNSIPDLQLIFNGQSFPLYWYEDTKKKEEEK